MRTWIVLGLLLVSWLLGGCSGSADREENEKTASRTEEPVKVTDENVVWKFCEVAAAFGVGAAAAPASEPCERTLARTFHFLMDHPATAPEERALLTESARICREVRAQGMRINMTRVMDQCTKSVTQDFGARGTARMKALVTELLSK